jgi:molybdopterin molybdotransferase
LLGALARMAVDTIDMGLVPDDPVAIRDTLERAGETADVVITSGGVSVGEADYVSKTLHDIGNVAFWKIAMRPGRPLACGKVGDAVFFGLPGNPVAVLVTFYEFVQPAVRRLMGCRDDGQPFRFRVPCTSALRKSSGRTEYQRGILYHDDDGQLAVKTTGKQGAGRLSSLCLANCIIVIPPNADAITPGSLVEVQPFTGLV